MVSEAIKCIRFYLLMITANLPYISGGCCMGWTSPILPMLMKNDSHIELDIDEGSWVVACLPLGAIIGPLLVSIFLDTLGRKWTLLLDMIVHMVSWIMLFVAKDRNLLYYGRLLNGFTMGIIFTSIPVYISETADEHNRNVMCSLNELFIGTGYLTAYAAGSFCDYYQTIIICLIPTVVFILLFIFAPETPYFLLYKDKREKALVQLEKLRMRTNEVRLDIEINKMQNLLNEYGKRQNPIVAMYNDKILLKEFFLAVGLLWCQQMCGATPIQAYTHNIFSEVSPSISSSLSTIAVGIIQIATSSVTPFIVQKLGVKIPLLISCVGVSTCLGTVAVGEFISTFKHYVVVPVWIPCISIIMFMVFYCIGLGPLPWVSMSEILAPSIKASASSIITSICFILFTITTKYYPFLNSFGSFVPFLFFAVVTVFSFLFILIFLPNTKQLTLSQIQDFLHGLKERSMHGFYSSIYLLSSGKLAARHVQQQEGAGTSRQRALPIPEESDNN